MGCGCGGGAQSGPVGAQSGPVGAVGIPEPAVAYVAVPAAGAARVFANGTSLENHLAAQLHAGANGGGMVRLATGTEVLSGQVVTTRDGYLAAVENLPAA